MQLKGNKLAAVLGTAEVCKLFYSAEKMSQKIVFYLVFNKNSKMVYVIFVPFVSSKLLHKKQKNEILVWLSDYK
jgi:hypothetical protein